MSHGFNAPLNDLSIISIKYIYQQLQEFYKSEEFKVTFNEDGGAGSKYIEIKKNGRSVAVYYFYPVGLDGIIGSIAIYGLHLDGHLKTISSSGVIFGFPVESIELVTENTASPFVDVILKHNQDDSSKSSVDDFDEIPYIDLSEINFKSSYQIRYVNGKSRPSHKTKRGIRIERNIEGKKGYTVTIYNLDSIYAVPGNNIQMAPKQMKVVSSNFNSTKLVGWGEDPNAFGHRDGSYANYGITIKHPHYGIDSIVLHMFDRSVDIEYFE